MSVLLISINVSASKKNGFLVLETYLTRNISINASGRFKGGSISPFVWANDKHFIEKDYLQIYDILQKNCVHLTKNTFYLDHSKLAFFIAEIKSKNVLFLDNSDKSLVAIEDLCLGEPKGKPKYSYSVGEFSLQWFLGKKLLLKQISRSDVCVKISNPQPNLVYSDKNQTYSLVFRYGNNLVCYGEKILSIKDDVCVYLRNYDYEQEVFQLLLNNGFVKISTNVFAYTGFDSFLRLRQKLENAGILINIENNLIIPRLRIKKVERGWFEIDLSCDMDGKVVDLASKMDVLSKRSLIKIENHAISIPESVELAKKNIVVKNNKIRISQRNIVDLLRIFHECDLKEGLLFDGDSSALKLPVTFFKKAYPYQLYGIKWLKYLFCNKFGACLADDMGLGKTFQVIAFLEELEVKKRIEKVLVVVPKSLLTNWEKEFIKFGSSYNVCIFHGEKKDVSLLENSKVIITTYNTAYLYLNQLNRFVYSLTIFDEVQIVKNFKSQLSSAMKEIKSQVKIALSGTPMENGLLELWNVLDIINPGLMGPLQMFLKRYKDSNRGELKEILDFFILRRMKKDVLDELPSKTEQIVYCDMEPKQRNLYTSLNIAIKDMFLRMGAFAAPIVLKGLTLLRECCCHPLLLDEKINVDKVEESCKLESLRILVNNLFASGHKILIFSNYTSMLNIIMEGLKQVEEYKDYIYYLDGKTNKRNDVVKQFEESEKGIFLISIKAGGVGLNLTSAQDVIIYDPWWNPFVEKQAIDRAYRIGQDKAVSVYKLIAVNSIEEKILGLQKEKIDDFDNLINGLSTRKNFDLNELINLL